MTRTDPVEIPLVPRQPCIYRLWQDTTCLYVGQTMQATPHIRIFEHRHDLWWPLVTRIDYVPAAEQDLDQAERDQIQELQPLFNIVGTANERLRLPRNGAAQLLEQLSRGPMSRTGISYFFQRNLNRQQLDALLDAFVADGVLEEYQVGSGIKATRMYALKATS